MPNQGIFDGDRLTVPYFKPRNPGDHDQNWRSLERWANRFPTSWIDFSDIAQVDQGASVDIAKTINLAAYRYESLDTIHVQFGFTMTAAGTANNSIEVLFPVPTVHDFGGSTVLVIGGGFYVDSGTAQYPTHIVRVSGLLDRVRMIRTDTALTNYLGIDPNFAIANTDNISGSFIYRIA